MYTLLASLFRQLSGRTTRGPALPRALMESAAARAGHDPIEARELRAAAEAYLRVVR